MKANRFYAAFILAAFLIVSLTACGGAQEAAGTNAMVYVSQSVPFTSPLDDLETVCIPEIPSICLGSFVTALLDMGPTTRIINCFPWSVCPWTAARRRP